MEQAAGRSGNGHAERNRFVVLPFVYPESPWVKKESAFSAGLADVSAEARGNADAGRAAGLDGQEAGNAEPDSSTAALSAASAVRIAEDEVLARLAIASREAEERGFERGHAAGVLAGRREAEPLIEAERKRLLAQGAALTESLDAARAEYFDQAERETARLALSIAARILRRELAMDPLLLTGAVRVALGQLAATTSVRLRVPARDRAMWAEALALIPRLNPRPQVVGDEAMETGDCRMETDLGSVDLGLRAQLRELERGLFEGDSEAGAQASREREEIGHGSMHRTPDGYAGVER